MFWWIQDSFGTQNHRGDPCYESMGLYLSGDLLQDRKKLKVDKHLLEKKHGSPTYPIRNAHQEMLEATSRFKNDDLQSL